MVTSKHFSEEEFQRCDPPCSLQEMDQEFINLIDDLRDECGFPLVLNCAYRSKEWDKSKGRRGNSAHTERCAVDFRCSSSAVRMKIVESAMKLGVTRVGIANTFVHVDSCQNLPQDVMWLY